MKNPVIGRAGKKQEFACTKSCYELHRVWDWVEFGACCSRTKTWPASTGESVGLLQEPAPEVWTKFLKSVRDRLKALGDFACVWCICFLKGDLAASSPALNQYPPVLEGWRRHLDMNLMTWHFLNGKVSFTHPDCIRLTWRASCVSISEQSKFMNVFGSHDVQEQSSFRAHHFWAWKCYIRGFM